MYWSTGIQYFNKSKSRGLLELGQQKRAKYQDDSKKVSKVSVSRVAGFAQIGQLTFFQLGWLTNGLPVSSNSISSGSVTGSCFSGTLTMPQASQLITGIGHPQYRCLDTPQSLNLKLVDLFPQLSSVAFFSIALKASSKDKPLNSPELIKISFSSKASSFISSPF